MARTPALLFGLLLFLFGFLGFVSNPLIGANALFAADAAHNSINLVLGAVLLFVVFRSERNAGLWLKIIGAAALLLGLVGLFTVPSSGGLLLGIAYTNGATDWFHFIIGLIALFALAYRDDRPRAG